MTATELEQPIWPDRAAVSTETLAKERREGVKHLLIAQFWPDPVPVDAEGRDIKFTCDDCSHAPCCSLAFDGYNTDDDCLASK